MARALRRQGGYDRVIPFNWVALSNHPGAAAWEGGRLARRIRAAVSRFPADEPVDLHVRLLPPQFLDDGQVPAGVPEPDRRGQVEHPAAPVVPPGPGLPNRALRPQAFGELVDEGVTAHRIAGRRHVPGSLQDDQSPAGRLGQILADP